MKKFIIIVLFLLASTLLALGAYFAWGVYLPVKEAPTADFVAGNTAFFVFDENGAPRQLTVKGVDLTSNIAGSYDTDFAADEEDYLRWLEAIAQMGANTVRVSTLMDDDFYNAFYTFNTTHTTPLYLIQGIRVSEKANTGKDDGFSTGFHGKLMKDAKKAVDIIHGRKVMPLNSSSQGLGYFLKDISKWTLGIIVGQEWNPNTVAYTNHNVVHEKTYQGDYFSAAEDSCLFEVMLAEIMDTMVRYESEKYGTQRPVAFICDPDVDFLEYLPENPLRIGKFVQLDPERVLPGQKMTAGTFAAYRLYDYCSDYELCLTDAQKEALGDLLYTLDSSKPYSGYLDLISAHHTMPILATGYGISSARGTISDTAAPKTEQQQGEELMRIYDDILDAQWAGACISEWQDNWTRDSWNTSFAVGLLRGNLWHNIQSDGQSYGLMAFEPGKDESICVVDGDRHEWEGDKPAATNGDRSVYLRYDAEAMYILITGVAEGETAVLPLDLNTTIGSATWEEAGMTFDTDADFLLCIDGRSNTRLLVQERYNATRENYLMQIAGSDPFADRPGRHDDDFGVATMATTIHYIYTMGVDGLWEPTLASRETGRLTYGTRNLEDPTYNSLADFCFGVNCVEIRIPWLMINVGDPTRMMIHSDYYRNYGVELERITSFRIGISGENKEDKVHTAKVSMSGLGNNVPAFRERLKQSYYVVQRSWAGGE